MKVTRESVVYFLDNSPEYCHRRYQYHVAAAMTGVTPEQAEAVSTILRRIRDILPNDKKGKELEKQWRIDNGKDSIVDHI